VSYCHLPPYHVDLAHVPLSGSGGVDWAVSAYGIPNIWRSTQGAGCLVAVIDSGIAPHPALDEAVVDRRNFTCDSQVYDTLGHGTHVAGVIAARGGAAQGVACQSRLLSLKVLGHSGMGKTESVAVALRHAVEAKCDIACMSLGSSQPDSRIHQAVQLAVASGCIVVCAAGNDGGSVNYPAAYAETIAVGAVGRDGIVCEFSSRGREITVAAPGQDITSTWLAGGYATLSGTSMAAPFVAGVLALWVSARKANNESASHSQAVEALAATAKDPNAPGRCDQYGWGLVDPLRLVGGLSNQRTGVTVFIPGAQVL
jgi:subtilisin